MFFWGPSHGPGVAKKLVFSFIDLEPDGCLVADQFRIRTKTFEITGAVNEKGLIQLWMMSLQKKTVLFCDGEVFSLDRGLLMGAQYFKEKA